MEKKEPWRVKTAEVKVLTSASTCEKTFFECAFFIFVYTSGDAARVCGFVHSVGRQQANRMQVEWIRFRERLHD